MALLPQTQVTNHYWIGRGIIQHMAQLYDDYKLVKIIRKQAKKIEKNSPETRMIRGRYKFGEPNKVDVIKQFKKPHWWLRSRSDAKVERSMSDSEDKYFTIVRKTEDNITYQGLKLTNDGWDFIEKTMFHTFPSGLVLAWTGKKSPISPIVSMIVSIIALGVSVLVAIYK